MNTIAFDRLTRTAAAGVTPRRSFLTLGAAGVAAALAAPYTVDAKKKKGKKKKQQQSPVPALVPAPAPAPAPVPVPAPDRCAPQVAECTATVANSICPDPSLPRCQRAAACCSHLGTCEFNQFFACLALISYVENQMDRGTFDTLTRAFTHPQPGRTTRRGITQFVAGLALGGPLALLGLTRAEAKCKKSCGPCKRCKQGKCKTKPAGTACTGGTCQKGACVASAPSSVPSASAAGCLAQCEGRVCGPDGCGGQCGPACRTGCCQNGTCVAGNAEAACGLTGEACQVCGTDSSCPFGECVHTCEGSAQLGIFRTIFSDKDGLKSIVARPVNADSSTSGFTPGTKEPVFVTTTKIDKTKDAVALFTLADSLGNVDRCGIRF
jgi:hypothetical protein